MKRRNFMKTTGIAVLGGGMTGGCAMTESGSGQADALFGYREDRVPMNAANLCPMPRTVRMAVQQYESELDADLSGVNRSRIEGYKQLAREGLAVQLGVSANEVAFVRNTSEANNILVQGLPLRSGDEVLIWDENHFSNAIAWAVRGQREGFSVRNFSVPVTTSSVEEVIAIFTGALAPNTRVISFTHISNLSGFKLPLAEICSALRARAPGLFIHVDGAQTLGIEPLDLGRIDCDSFSASAHKWYMGPREVGVLVVRAGQEANIFPGVISVPWGNQLQSAQPGAMKFDCLGQRNDAGLAGMAEAVRFHDELTPTGVKRTASALADQLRAGIVDLGLPLLSPMRAPFTSNVVVLQVPPENRAALVQKLLTEYGVITVPVNGLRVSPHIYNTSAQIDRLLQGIGSSRSMFG